MALEFLHREARHSARIALFPGAYNPPTVAHAEIARAALDWADEVILILPRALPHKGFEHADFATRCEMLHSLAASETAFSAATSVGGLFAEIAGEARETLGASPEIALVCGRDAAERVASWDYGRAGVFDEFLAQYRLLVADRAGDFRPSPGHADRVMRLHLRPGVAEEVSSTEVRRRIEMGLPWEHLVPAAIAATVRNRYGIN